ncbi:MAG: MarR family transcriptional regulator [Candidatus Aenigmarchaeota archaeon]|nr:MarR family transcriptional regulator [Candidatus Aenigmarchaeota archaeon]
MAPTMRMAGYLLVVVSIALLAALSVVKADVDIQAAFLCEMISEAGQPMNICPAHTSNTSWVITGAFGIAFLILGVGTYMTLQPRGALSTAIPGGREPEGKRQVTPPDPAHLDQEENVLCDLLVKGGGSAYQSDLIRSSGMSKVKVTRILDKMEAKGMLERRRRGMANIIVLK